VILKITKYYVILFLKFFHNNLSLRDKNIFSNDPEYNPENAAKLDIVEPNSNSPASSSSSPKNQSQNNNVKFDVFAESKQALNEITDIYSQGLGDQSVQLLNSGIDLEEINHPKISMSNENGASNLKGTYTIHEEDDEDEDEDGDGDAKNNNKAIDDAVISNQENALAGVNAMNGNDNAFPDIQHSNEDLFTSEFDIQASQYDNSSSGDKAFGTSNLSNSISSIGDFEITSYNFSEEYFRFSLIFTSYL